jgi:2-(1,2-epoxy-1,2-dihydrophenyl)acetyl-CoA isomerase
MSEAQTFVQTELEAGVLTITLNRPKVNAFNYPMIEQTQAAFKQAGKDEGVRCVLLTGEGHAFSAGQDVGDIQSAQGTSFRGHLQRTYNPLILQIRRLAKPVLGALNGPASGAALGVALACDLRIAADSASLVVGFARLGLAPDSGVSLFLPALIGLGRASQYTFSNEPIQAQTALELGLVNRVVPAEELQNQALSWARQLARGPVDAMGLAKRAFNKAFLSNLEAVLDYEAHLQDIAARGNEHQEGLQAFLEKREPKF